MRAISLGLCLAASFGLGACASSSPAPEAEAAQWGGQHFLAWQDTDPEYRFFPGDSVDVTVHSAPELSSTAEIGPDGRINLPLLANVMVANKTDYEIASVIADAYARNVLVSPIVEVRRATLGPQNIIVGGEVNSPGLIALPSPIGALEAVMLAGGFRDTASRQVAILRRGAGGGLMLRTVNLRDALRGRDGADALQLRRNDIVFVPRTTVAEINVFIEQYVNSILPLDQAMSYAIANAINNN
ncbi:polysaccharide biosynthesis/export family protein [uncultured Maricaulis sp.]|uniref:polysaccharide biosynthesis/export family protein n=1 Tax=uncultured Maricaulis sp. TaxID=174710 RepID=UPI0030D7A840|tara:strand:- start:15321 stop:16049 length:729 start_codon:yes stop_codon:yes gene_type:complete